MAKADHTGMFLAVISNLDQLVDMIVGLSSRLYTAPLLTIRLISLSLWLSGQVISRRAVAFNI